MSSKNKKILFWISWFFLIISPFITLSYGFPSEKTLGEQIFLLSYLQRLTGMLAYIFLTIQIILGSNMAFFTSFLGTSAFRLHKIQGVLAYFLILIHPLFGTLKIYKLENRFLLINLSSVLGVYLFLGSLAIFLISFALVSVFFRLKPPFRKNWRLFHSLNYVAFYFVFFHSFIGSDISSLPFSSVRFVSFFLVLFVSIRRLFKILTKTRI